MTDKGELTGSDYLNRPVLELMSHPDYSNEAMRKMVKIGRMTSKQIENIVLYGGNN